MPLPTTPRGDGSVDCSVVVLPAHVKVSLYRVAGNGLLVQWVGGLGREKTGREIIGQEVH